MYVDEYTYDALDLLQMRVQYLLEAFEKKDEEGIRHYLGTVALARDDLESFLVYLRYAGTGKDSIQVLERACGLFEENLAPIRTEIKNSVATVPRYAWWELLVTTMKFSLDEDEADEADEGDEDGY